MTSSLSSVEGTKDEVERAALTGAFIEALTTRSSTLAGALRTYKRLSRTKPGDAEAMVAWLESAARATADDPDLNLKRTSLLRLWTSAASQGFLRIEADLRDACRARSWQVDGQWPDLYVERGVLVHMSTKDRTATVGRERLRSSNVPAIMKALEDQVATLIPSTFSPSTFIDELAAAYDELTGDGGGQRSLLDVYRVVVIRVQSAKFWKDAHAKSFTPFGVDQLRARLGRALAAGVTSASDGRQLRLLPPLDPRDAVFVHLPTEGRFAFIGRIEFVRPVNGGAA